MPHRVVSHQLRSMAAAALALGTILCDARAEDPAETVFSQASQSVVTVLAFDRQREPIGLGSGVVIARERVVTNCHVLATADAVSVVYQENGTEATVVDSMVNRDLCLLAVVGLPAPAISLGTSADLRVGQRVFALGAPHGLELTFSEGMISSLRLEGKDYIIQTSAPISPGSSGGALLSREGQLIGITTLQHATGQNLNFAVPVDWVKQFRSLARR